jgi:hypothetical protein
MNEGKNIKSSKKIPWSGLKEDGIGIKFIMVIIIILIAIFLKPILNHFGKTADIKKEICGIIVRKYQDNDYGHGAAMIVYSTKDKEQEECIDTWTNDLWYYLAIGDSIIKHTGTLIIRIKKPDKSFKDFDYKD